MVINHLEKLFVTSDAATIMRELEVVHPAAKLLVNASQQQEAEVSCFFFCLIFPFFGLCWKGLKDSFGSSLASQSQSVILLEFKMIITDLSLIHSDLFIDG